MSAKAKSNNGQWLASKDVNGAALDAKGLFLVYVGRSNASVTTFLESFPIAHDLRSIVGARTTLKTPFRLPGSSLQLL